MLLLSWLKLLEYTKYMSAGMQVASLARFNPRLQANRELWFAALCVEMSIQSPNLDVFDYAPRSNEAELATSSHERNTSTNFKLQIYLDTPFEYEGLSRYISDLKNGRFGLSARIRGGTLPDCSSRL